MAIVAPQGRQHLAAEALLPLVRSGFATLPDDRPGDPDISFPEALRSACAMLSLKAPSRLAGDQERAEGNWHPIYGIERVPGDTYRREILAPASPESLRPVFKSILRQLQRGTAREPRTFLDGHSLGALDGTGSFSSKTMPCASGLHKVHRHGSGTSAHQRLGAAMVHPDFRAVIPLRPAPIVKHDGTGKHDGARHAAKRFLVKLRPAHPHLPLIGTEDRLRSKAPPIETLPEQGWHSRRGVKDSDHASLFAQVQAAEHAGRVTY